MRIQPLIILGLATTPTLAQSQGFPDLVFNSLEILSIEFVDSRFEIEIGYEILNVGPSMIDLAGPDPIDPIDNVAIQTYMTFNENQSEPFYASGGGVITNPEILLPGESFESSFFANTTHIPDPLNIDPGMWIVLDIVTNSIPSEFNKNNRGMIQVPSPSGAALLAATGALCMGRRRR